MPKFLFLLPLVGLAACSANETKEEADLSPGIMQPVSGSGAAEGSYSWPSDVRSAPMPSSMTK